MLNTEENIEGLNKRTLSVAAAAVLVPLAGSVTEVVEQAVWKAGRTHILASREEWTQLVEEGRGSAFLAHAAEDLGDLDQAGGELCQDGRQAGGVVGVHCVDGLEHLADESCSCCFDSDGDHVEPFFVLGAGEGGNG